jgi:hypothetical protein
MATTQTTTDAADFGEKDTRKDDMREATEEFVEDLIAEADSAGESETMKEFLDAQSAFHDYSHRNALLIKMQCPHATRVAGYRTWQENFDRQVQAGEEAIHILYPRTAEHTCPKCGNTPDYHDSIGCEYDEKDPEEWDSGVVTWRTGSVFDVSQTEGEPLAELPTDAEGEADDLLDAMLTAADDLVSSVEIVPGEEWTHGATKGVCDTTEQTIEVKDRTNAAVAGTLAHELAHARLHRGNETDDRQERELEAEAVAYVVGRHFGLDVSGSGFYLAAWENDDAEEIRGHLKRINQTASTIIDAITAEIE